LECCLAVCATEKVFMKAKRNKGFTLVEIIIVVIVIGVIASLGLPRMTGTMERFRAAEGVQIITALLHAQKAYFQENSAYCTNANIGQLDITIDNPEYFTYAVASANPIATATRIGGQYRLNMSDTAVITCTNLGGAGFTCAQAGH
jgi:prepilin-type N-terminal cleavage/methylation domain-containing protein